MATDFFRVERGFEISDTGIGSLVQILTGTVAPDTQADAQDAPVGSLWIINAGTSSTTRVYQKFRDSTNDKYDWRDITGTISWLEPAKVADTSTWANIAAVELELNGTTTNNGPLKTAQTQANYNGTPPNGSFTVGTGYNAGDVITLSNGATITVNTVTGGPPGPVATFTVTTAGTPVNAGAVLTQTSVAPAGGTGFTLTTGTANLQPQLGGLDTPGTFVNGDRILITDLTTGTEGVYLVNGTPGSGATLVLDPANDPTDGDAILINEGTFADGAFLYNGTQWISFGSGSAAEEGYIRQFIGKDTAGAETPNYATPTTTSPGDQVPTGGTTPFTAATSANGYIVNTTDNLELAVAKLNQEVFQNTRHLYATGVTTLSDTLPTNVDGAKWLVRVEQGTSVRQYEVTATMNSTGTAVDSTNFALTRHGANITGLAVTVTAAGGALVVTASTTGASTFEIRRIATVGVPGTVGRALFV